MCGIDVDFNEIVVRYRKFVRAFTFVSCSERETETQGSRARENENSCGNYHRLDDARRGDTFANSASLAGERREKENDDSDLMISMNNGSGELVSRVPRFQARK